MSALPASPPAPDSARRALPTPLLVAGAVLGFAANSLLCRMALGAGLSDAASFTALRLGAGALALTLIAFPRRGEPSGGGGFGAGAALFLYAASFSFAYLRLGAATGALILFGTVQAALLLWGVREGERPPWLEWLGLGLALAGLVWLTLPSATAPDALGALLMASAGIAWVVYTVLGRRARAPLRATAANFVRSVPFAFALLLLMARFGGLAASPVGVALAVLSGALTSGGAYVLWYAALPRLSSAQAALVQLAVPPLAALGAVAVLGEPLSPRLVGASVTVLGGIALATVARARTVSAGGHAPGSSPSPSR